MKYLSIETKLGVLHGRNRVYIDTFYQSSNKIFFKGDISCNSDMLKSTGKKFIPYTLKFDDVKFYRCGWIDIVEQFYADSISCFDEILDSPLIEKYKLPANDFRHFFLQTYDYLYEIIAKEFILEIDF